MNVATLHYEVRRRWMWIFACVELLPVVGFGWAPKPPGPDARRKAAEGELGSAIRNRPPESKRSVARREREGNAAGLKAKDGRPSVGVLQDVGDGRNEPIPNVSRMDEMFVATSPTTRPSIGGAQCGTGKLRRNPGHAENPSNKVPA
jgi:hypothetical protein